MVRLAHYKAMYNKMDSFLSVPHFPPYGNILPRWVPADQSASNEREGEDEEDIPEVDADDSDDDADATYSRMIKKRGLPRVSYTGFFINMLISLTLPHARILKCCTHLPRTPHLTGPPFRSPYHLPPLRG